MKGPRTNCDGPDYRVIRATPTIDQCRDLLACRGLLLRLEACAGRLRDVITGIAHTEPERAESFRQPLAEATADAALARIMLIVVKGIPAEDSDVFDTWLRR